MNNNQTDIRSLGFDVQNNVEIEVRDDKLNIVRQRFEVHNKATRKMVTGLLRFMSGHFTDTYCNKKPQYDYAKEYIPCYIGFGDGAIEYDQEGKSHPISVLKPQVPRLEQDSKWTEVVNYESTKFRREIDWYGERTKIEKISETYTNVATADMDSLYFHCEVGPTVLNGYRPNSGSKADPTVPVYITELGLFANNIPNQEDLLAYVKLSNYDDNDKTRILYVRPSDTVIVRWVITIAAIGKDSVLKANVLDENGEIVTNDVVMVPELVPVDIITIPDEENQNNG